MLNRHFNLMILLPLSITAMSGCQLDISTDKIWGQLGFEEESTSYQPPAERPLDGVPVQEADGYIIRLKAEPLLARFNPSEFRRFDVDEVKEAVEAIADEHNEVLSRINTTESLDANGLPMPPKILQKFRHTLNAISANYLSASELEDIKKLPHVVSVEKERLFHATLHTSHDSVTTLPHGVEQLWGRQLSREKQLNGQGITVGVMDTGIDYTHPDLGGCLGEGCRVRGGYDFINNDENPIDDHGHGTHVASIIGGNGLLRGVAPHVDFYALKVLSASGSGSTSGIIKAIEYAMDPNGDCCPENDDSCLFEPSCYDDRLDIINLSLGGAGHADDATSQAIDRAVASGVIAVVAAGNDGPKEQTIGSPGTARNAITVAAIDREGNLAEFSSRGPALDGEDRPIAKPDIAGAGVSICAAFPKDLVHKNPGVQPCLGDHYALASGTSMATPHVAGALALVKQAYPALSPLNIKQLIMDEAVPSPEYSADEVGAGRLNIDFLFETDEPTLVAAFDQLTQHHDLISLVAELGILGEDNKSDLEHDAGTFDAQESGLFDANYEYTLSVKTAQTEKQILASGSIPHSVKKRQLLKEFRLDGFREEKPIELELLVTDEHDEIVAFDRRNLWVDHMKLSHANYDPPNINLYGRVSAPYGPPKLWVKSSEQSWEDATEITFTGQSDGLLGSLSRTQLDSGFYDFKLESFDETGEQLGEEVLSHFYLDNRVTPGWPVKMAGAINSTPVVTDLNNDGDLEVIITDTKGGLNVVRANGLPLPGWPVDTEERFSMYQTPVAVDINNDGIKEILVPTWWQQIKAYDYTGNEIASPFIDGPFGYVQIDHGHYTSTDSPKARFGFTICDLDQDGEDELIANSYDNIGVYEHDGTYIFSFEVMADPEKSSSFNTQHTKVACDDLDNDGDMEMVFAVGTGHIQVFDHLGQKTAEYAPQIPVNSWAFYAGISVGDVDGDGDKEIFVGTNPEFVAMHHDGTRLEGEWPTRFGIMHTGVALLDLDGDELPEVVRGPKSNMLIDTHPLRAYDADGTDVNGFPISISGGINILGFPQGQIPPPLGADLTGDGRDEIILASHQFSRIIIYDADGNKLEDTPRPFSQKSGLETYGGPLLTDLDQDGRYELLQGDIYGNMISWSLGYEIHPQSGWMAPNGNPNQNGQYCTNCNSDISQAICGVDRPCDHLDCLLTDVCNICEEEIENSTNCDDANPCTLDACTPYTDDNQSGCINQVIPLGTICGDDLYCNLEGNCLPPVCENNADCDDGDPCTENICSRPNSGLAQCITTQRPIDASCGDNLYCTAEGDCDVHHCETLADCEDNDPCTTDACLDGGTAASQCINNSIPTHGSCGDDMRCDEDGQCVIPACGTHSDCEQPENPCEHAYCLRAGRTDAYCRIFEQPKNRICGPLQMCDDDAQCIDVACRVPSDCDDGDPCTIDSCEDKTTIDAYCQHAPVESNDCNLTSDPEVICPSHIVNDDWIYVDRTESYRNECEVDAYECFDVYYYDTGETRSATCRNGIWQR